MFKKMTSILLALMLILAVGTPMVNAATGQTAQSVMVAVQSDFPIYMLSGSETWQFQREEAMGWFKTNAMAETWAFDTACADSFFDVFVTGDTVWTFDSACANSFFDVFVTGDKIPGVFDSACGAGYFTVTSRTGTPPQNNAYYCTQAANNQQNTFWTSGALNIVTYAKTTGQGQWSVTVTPNSPGTVPATTCWSYSIASPPAGTADTCLANTVAANKDTTFWNGGVLTGGFCTGKVQGTKYYWYITVSPKSSDPVAATTCWSSYVVQPPEGEADSYLANRVDYNKDTFYDGGTLVGGTDKGYITVDLDRTKYYWYVTVTPNTDPVDAKTCWTATPVDPPAQSVLNCERKIVDKNAENFWYGDTLVGGSDGGKLAGRKYSDWSVTVTPDPEKDADPDTEGVQVALKTCWILTAADSFTINPIFNGFIASEAALNRTTGNAYWTRKYDFGLNATSIIGLTTTLTGTDPFGNPAVVGTDPITGDPIYADVRTPDPATFTFLQGQNFGYIENAGCKAGNVDMLIDEDAMVNDILNGTLVAPDGKADDFLGNNNAGATQVVLAPWSYSLDVIGYDPLQTGDYTLTTNYTMTITGTVRGLKTLLNVPFSAQVGITIYQDRTGW